MIILSAAVAGALVLFVLGPLLGWGASPAWEAGEEAAQRHDDQVARRREILASIKDLEMEHAMGKLTREDFERTREQLAREAASLLRQTAPDAAD